MISSVKWKCVFPAHAYRADKYCTWYPSPLPARMGGTSTSRLFLAVWFPCFKAGVVFLGKRDNR